MFEFHGWAVIRVADEEDLQVIGGRKDQAIKQVRAALNEAHDEFSVFEILKCGNDLDVLVVHGLRNHRYQPVLDLFSWVAAHLPECYGLLYVHNDEDEDEEYEDRFRVWRLARGELTLHEDSLLSPWFPTIDPPYDLY